VSLEYLLTLVVFVLFRDSLRGRCPCCHCRTLCRDCLGALRLAFRRFVFDHGLYPRKGYYFQQGHYFVEGGDRNGCLHNVGHPLVARAAGHGTFWVSTVMRSVPRPMFSFFLYPSKQSTASLAVAKHPLSTPLVTQACRHLNFHQTSSYVTRLESLSSIPSHAPLLQ